MRQPMFSIIMPVYNGMKFIDKAINSVLHQDYKDFEFIIIDDRSTDDTVNYITQIQEKYSEVVKLVLLEKNGGIGNARNQGILTARGQFLMFIDQDDILIENAFSSVASNIDENDVYAFGCIRIDEEDNEIGKFPLIVNDGKQLRWDLCTVWTYAVRRSLIIENEIQFPINCMNEDLIFSIKVAGNTSKIKVVPQCLYAHRVNIESTSNRMYEKFDQYPLSREMVYKTAKEVYDITDLKEDRKQIFLTVLAYHYSIFFGIFRNVEKDVKIKEYRNHRIFLEKYFGDYLHDYKVSLFSPKCRRLIYRLVVCVSFYMEKCFGQKFYEWFIVLMGNKS